MKTTTKTRTRDLLAGQTILARKRAELIEHLRTEVAVLRSRLDRSEDEIQRLQRELDAERRDRRAA